MDVASYEKVLAALLGWREEAKNGLNGMVAVIFVVRNRARANWQQGQWCEIITTHNQFSSISVPGDGQLVKWPDPHDQNFVKLLQAVDGIYDGTTPDVLTNGALYYMDPGPGVTPGGWFERTVLANPTRFPRCAQIGSTVYFKDLGAGI